MPSDNQETLRRESPLRKVAAHLTDQSRTCPNMREAEVLALEAVRVNATANIHEAIMVIEDELGQINATLAALFGNGGPVSKALWAIANAAKRPPELDTHTLAQVVACGSVEGALQVLHDLGRKKNEGEQR